MKAHTTQPPAHAPQPAHDFATDHPAATLMLQLLLIPAFIGVMVLYWVRRTRAKLGYRTVTVARRGR